MPQLKKAPMTPWAPDSVTKKADFETPDEKYSYNLLSQLTTDLYKTYSYDSVDNRLKTNQEALFAIVSIS